MNAAPSLAARFYSTGRICAAALVALGVAVLVGWTLDIPALARVLPGQTSMKANSALLFLLLGVALLVAEAPARRGLRVGLGLFVVMVALLTLLEYAFAVDLGIDELLVRDTEAVAPNAPGRMAIASCVNFLLLGLAVATSDAPAAVHIRHAAVLVASGVAFVAVCSYLFGVHELPSAFLNASGPLPPALGFLLAATSYALAPSQYVVDVLASDTVTGRLLRRLLPIIVILPVFVGWLMLEWQPHSVEFDVAVVVVSIVLLLGLVVWTVANRLYQAEAAERDAHEELAVRERQEITERKRNADRFRLALEAAPTGMLLVDRSGSILLVNSQIERMFGYDRMALLGQSIEILVPHRYRARHPTYRAQYDDRPTARPMGGGRELFGLRSDGTEIPVEIGLTPTETPEGRVVIASIVDITERRSELRYRALFDESPVALWEKDYSAALAFLRERMPSEQLGEWLTTHPELIETAAAKVRIVDVNRRGLELFGAADLPELAARWTETLGPEGYKVIGDELLALFNGQSGFETEGLRRTLTGQLLHVRVQVTAVSDAATARVIVSVVDITASKAAERALRESVGRQEVLLREIHHRVKNNLAVIASLFYLESTHTSDARAVALLEDSRRRIRSIALVHETLYRSDNFATIDMAEYAQILANEVLAACQPLTGRVQLSTDLQPVWLDLDLAIPCGLILNELLCNAFKHAFPNGRSGAVHVSLHGSGTHCVLRVHDDGVGLPADVDVATGRSLGLRLVRLLTKQLRGVVEFERQSAGTEARVSFPRSHDER